MGLRCTSGRRALVRSTLPGSARRPRPCARSQLRGRSPERDFDTSARWLRDGVGAIEVGSRDEGLVSAIAFHHMLSGGEQAVSDEFLERSVEAALVSDDLHRQVWVLAYAGHVAEALTRAQRLGNRTLIACQREAGTPHARANDTTRPLSCSGKRPRTAIAT